MAEKVGYKNSLGGVQNYTMRKALTQFQGITEKKPWFGKTVENTVSTPGELFAILSLVFVTRRLGYDLPMVASKFTRGTQNMSSREMEQFLSKNDPLYHDGNVTWTSEDMSPLPLSVNI